MTHVGGMSSSSPGEERSQVEPCTIPDHKPQQTPRSLTNHTRVALGTEHPRALKPQASICWIRGSSFTGPDKKKDAVNFPAVLIYRQ